VESFDKGRELPGWATFFADGTPSARLSKAGAFERFYPNGAPREKGTIGPKGRRQGKWIWFGKNGKPERTGSYQAGRLNGEVITMGQDGKPAQRDQFRNGLLVSPRCPPGVRMSRSEEQRQISCRDDKGQQHGPQYFFDEDGRYNVWTYEHGVLHGLYQNGWTELHYVHGVLQGPTVSWYRESDQKLREGQYDQDKETGLWTSWYEDGKVAQLGRYVEGKRDGVWELFRKDGSKWLVVTFANGEVKSSRGFDASGAEAAKADPLETVLEAMPRTVAERHFADMGEKATVARPEEAMGEEDGEDRVCRSVLAEAFRVVAREWLPQLLEVKPERAESGAAQPAGTERSAP
jgi:antitoxin component YwqK of YwqJK toxin-antitoxin module